MWCDLAAALLDSDLRHAVVRVGVDTALVDPGGQGHATPEAPWERSWMWKLTSFVTEVALASSETFSMLSCKVISMFSRSTPASSSLITRSSPLANTSAFG